MHEHLSVAAGDSGAALHALRSATSVRAASLGVPVRMQSRVKSLYSTWKKMERKGIDVDGIHDRVAMRLITANEADARTLLADIHDRYEPVDGEFDDYIRAPKPNGYQSLHTAVRTPYGVAEFQLRTEAMHEAAEAGDQAHWLYKRMS
jgi:GTP pyrophosphokinase